MGTFLEQEKRQQAQFKAISPHFSEAARADGLYRGRPRPFCVPSAHAEENLFPAIRQSALEHFATHGIQWRAGRAGKLSHHLCDSQVCCVNFLFPLANRPDALATILRPLFPALRAMRPVEDGHYVAFEWTGHDDYLRERGRPHPRTRGAPGPSADAAVLFERTDGTRQLVLIAWKYTEASGGLPRGRAMSGTDRTASYRPLLARNDCPLNRDRLPAVEALFSAPFFQFMRQQFLAHEMERAKELGASTVSVLHIAPAHNTEAWRVTSPALADLGETATDVWRQLVRLPGRFLSVSTEPFFGSLPVEHVPDMGAWLEHLGARYPWVRTDRVILPRPRRSPERVSLAGWPWDATARAEGGRAGQTRSP